MIAPLVTNSDREWAMRQCPAWARRSKIETVVGEIVDDGGWLDADAASEPELDKPNWDLFVVEQIERFERYFAHERKSYEDWSNLWRFSWWPNAKPEKRFPKMAPKVPYPFFKAGTPEFARALKVGTDIERRIWKRFGVAQFVPNDPRLDRVRSAPIEQGPAVRGKDFAAGNDR